MPDGGLIFEMLAVVAAALGGTLLGIAGGKGGDLARRGERPAWIGLVLRLVMVLGGVSFAGAGAALVLGHPVSVWVWLAAVGGVLIFLPPGVGRHLDTLRPPSSETTR